ncbi:hypothetical protein H0H81_011633 [Sphagnurus paluster]|uniref:Uncharacterized protein n=1 Tax=Sphagnurus paluster TaxID=117069 RepID=A0A9P7GHD7_9AGAR|nr:hypothetical protein H0H81_011633 [Sphagnurus paluster]
MVAPWVDALPEQCFSDVFIHFVAYPSIYEHLPPPSRPPLYQSHHDLTPSPSPQHNPRQAVLHADALAPKPSLAPNTDAIAHTYAHTNTYADTLDAKQPNTNAEPDAQHTRERLFDHADTDTHLAEQREECYTGNAIEQL